MFQVACSFSEIRGFYCAKSQMSETPIGSESKHKKLRTFASYAHKKDTCKTAASLKNRLQEIEIAVNYNEPQRTKSVQ